MIEVRFLPRKRRGEAQPARAKPAAPSTLRFELPNTLSKRDLRELLLKGQIRRAGQPSLHRTFSKVGRHRRRRKFSQSLAFNRRIISWSLPE
ncbi:MAG: hypothetical protein LC672_06665, partial [Acidobacteria bacterium]|nr:hypothetical protein [Acidobacteriota bacterium]